MSTIYRELVKYISSILFPHPQRNAKKILKSLQKNISHSVYVIRLARLFQQPRDTISSHEREESASWVRFFFFFLCILIVSSRPGLYHANFVLCVASMLNKLLSRSHG